MKKNNYSILLFFILLVSCYQKSEIKDLPPTLHIEVSKNTLNLVDLKFKEQLGKDTIITVINDPVFNKTKKYHAISAVTLINKNIDLKRLDTKNTKIIFICQDGYLPEMPLDLFLKSNPYIATSDMDTPKGDSWEPLYKHGNKVIVAPFYLVYPTISTTDIHYKRPYNLLKIELKPLNENKAALYPKDDLTLVSGYELFHTYCLTCHSINGNGGSMGPELNAPKSVTSYWNESDLVAYIVNPASYRNKVKMPTLGISKQQAEEIVAYLKYMSKKNKK